WETWAGMAISNLVAFFIMLTTAVTLHVNGVTDIQTAEQAAEALRPIAGDAAFVLFSLGLIGTGLLAIPVLAGSAAYAAAEARGWRTGLERPLNEARPFYLVVAVAILLGLAVGFTPLDPIKALLWSAVLNGVIVVPIMAAMMIVASRRNLMGDFVATLWQRLLGWTATAIMGAAAVAMFVLM
ncbi:MAG: divalent metal cation transporter, partial [Reyranella sp.]